MKGEKEISSQVEQKADDEIISFDYISIEDNATIDLYYRGEEVGKINLLCLSDHELMLHPPKPKYHTGDIVKYNGMKGCIYCKFYRILNEFFECEPQNCEIIRSGWHYGIQFLTPIKNDDKKGDILGIEVHENQLERVKV